MGTAKPQLGIKIGRQPWIKGRSIKHCLDMGHGRMSVEEKIDGEYCQIHIDPNKGDRCIQIFSKSGKDSTEDRVALHGSVLNDTGPAQANITLRTIIESLKIGQPDARVTKGCILEGELVVYDDYVCPLMFLLFCNSLTSTSKIKYSHFIKSGSMSHGEVCF